MINDIRNRLELQVGDITQLAVDAIVNAANQSLLGGGGVDGAIHRAAGPQLVKECRSLGGCLPGKAKITQGYDLLAKYVIHTVGPIYKGKPEDEQILSQCYRNSLSLAAKHQCRIIAFPAISCGAYGYPFEAACKVAIDNVAEILSSNTIINKVIFILFTDNHLAIYADYLKQKFN
jgi:O-acetyl-ADP-ribose deacetylase (regulator of RNase III)